MKASPRYPFSDLTPEEVQALVAVAREERARTIRAVFSTFLTLPRAFKLPPRQREAQAWPPKGVPALSLASHH